MDFLISLFEQIIHYIKDPGDLVRAVGLIGIVIIVFVETGLLVGFFLPGDSLLLTAGLFAAKGDLDIWQLVIYTQLLPLPATPLGILLEEKRVLCFTPERIAFSSKNPTF